jgi:hypothetical protein
MTSRIVGVWGWVGRSAAGGKQLGAVAERERAAMLHRAVERR